MDGRAGKKIQTGKKKYKYFGFVFPGVKKSKSKFTKKNNDEHAMADYCIYRFYQPLSMLVNRPPLRVEGK